MAVRGRALAPEVKKLILSVKLYFDRNKSKEEASVPSVQKAAEATNIGIATVKRRKASKKKAFTRETRKIR
jgi:hypothetical protein